MHADQSAALCIQMQPPRIGWMSTWRFPHTTSLSSPYFTYLEESQDISGIWHDFIIHRAGRAKHPSQGWRMNEENEDWRPITKYYKSKCNTQSSNQQKLQYITNHIWHTYNLTMGTGNPVDNHRNNQLFKLMKQDGTLHITITISHAYFSRVFISIETLQYKYASSQQLVSRVH